MSKKYRRQRRSERLRFSNSAMLKKENRHNGETRYHLHTTITRRVMGMLRGVIFIGRGGRLGPLVEASLEIMLALLSQNIEQDRVMLSRVVGRFLESFNLDMRPMRQIADNMRYIASMFDSGDVHWESETGKKYSVWYLRQKRQDIFKIDVRDLLLPYDEKGS